MIHVYNEEIIRLELVEYAFHHNIKYNEDNHELFSIVEIIDDELFLKKLRALQIDEQ